MKSNNEILNEYGKKLIEFSFDPAIGNLLSLRIKENPPIIFEDYVNLFKKIDSEDFVILQKYLEESVGGVLFNVLRIFEEDERFRLIYEENGQQVDLVKISEMLKAEPIIKNGWIERFSKYADKRDK
ncbi:hypothetical protein EQP59_02840 [Ornithobacterium rhinotracheale]|uniref:Uncharacterized protein n=1 Tax=Ornithobacterium rhinotracheale TaxID=28251 RepID=A0A3R5UWR0_ORNRH|nr:hypothetical protein [Ornithobacterium rhinotracheale]QAR30365.1 hypothetical protein EQP59_02840 [Ornithobacterium rhinotracheale]